MIRILILMLLPNLCFAGGDYSEVSIKNFTGSGSNANFTIEFVNDRKFDESCDALKVSLKYKRVPWYSWLPFVHSSHPTQVETREAVMHLEESFKENLNVYFGYIGGGLIPTDKPCEYVSKGLNMDEFDNYKYIHAFHDPV